MTNETVTLTEIQGELQRIATLETIDGVSSGLAEVALLTNAAIALLIPDKIIFPKNMDGFIEAVKWLLPLEARAPDFATEFARVREFISLYEKGSAA